MEGLVVFLSIFSVVISIIFFRARKKSKVFAYWLPLFAIALLWTIQAISPIIRVSGMPTPDAGFVGMEAAFIFWFNFPFIVLFVGLVISFPRKEAWHQNMIVGGSVATVFMFIASMYVFSQVVNFEVRDQHKKPVPETTVVYRLHMQNIFFPFKGKGYVRTNKEGKASIRYYYFQKLVIRRIRKEGYTYTGGGDKLNFPAKWPYPRALGKRNQTTTKDPVVLNVFEETKERKKFKGERVSYDPYPPSLTILSDRRGSKSVTIPVPGASNDLKIRVKREFSAKDPYFVGNWAYLISASGGIQLAETLTNTAPIEGYKKASGRRFTYQRKGYDEIADATYYFRTSTGLYGKLSINVWAADRRLKGDLQNSSLKYEYWINNAGGHTLYHGRQRRYMGKKIRPPLGSNSSPVIHSFNE